MARQIKCDVRGCPNVVEIWAKWEEAEKSSTRFELSPVSSRRAKITCDVFDICDDCLEKGKLEIRFVPDEEDALDVVHLRSQSPVSDSPSLARGLRCHVVLAPGGITTTASVTIPETPTPEQLITGFDNEKPSWAVLLGRRVKRLRERKGLDQGGLEAAMTRIIADIGCEDIEEHASTFEGVVSRIEAGESNILDGGGYSILASALGVSVRYLETGDDD